MGNRHVSMEGQLSISQRFGFIHGLESLVYITAAEVPAEFLFYTNFGGSLGYSLKTRAKLLTYYRDHTCA